MYNTAILGLLIEILSSAIANGTMIATGPMYGLTYSSGVTPPSDTNLYELQLLGVG